MTPPTKEILTKRLKRLRELMKERNLAAYIVPTADAHQSEYVSEDLKRREFISGFTGSAGTAVIMEAWCGLWTDARYFIQAENELDSSNWTLMKMRSGTPSIAKFLASKLPSSSAVGVDPFTCTVDWAETVKHKWCDAGAHLVLKTFDTASSSSDSLNLVDIVWNEEPRKVKPISPITVHAMEYAGNSVQNKIEMIRREVENVQCNSILITALDDIAWLLNLRGSDISYTPVFLSYVLLAPDECILFVDTDGEKVTDEVREHLSSANVSIQDYSSILSVLGTFSNKGKNIRILIDTSLCNLALRECLGKNRNVEVVETTQSSVAVQKCQKNRIEVKGMREAYIADGVAMVKLMSWLEHKMETEAHAGTELSEADVSDKLIEFRKLNDAYIGESFKSICSVGANASIVHYSFPEDGTSAKLDCNGLFLLDTGAQYLSGTTDTTRTLVFNDGHDNHDCRLGSLSRCYTRVLQGHIALATAIFPPGVCGEQLDTLARAPLWRDHLDYEHGTGHGVGAYLNVHEFGPGIFASSKRRSTNSPSLVPGMIVSNEPGCYADGKWGIRIESVLLVKGDEMEEDHDHEHNQTHNHKDGKDQRINPFPGYLTFETLTVVPLERTLINIELLSTEEIRWINAYHKQCRDVLEPLLIDERELAWLRMKTQVL